MEGGQQIAAAVVPEDRGGHEVAAAQADAAGQEALDHAGDVLQAVGVEIALREQEQRVPGTTGPSKPENSKEMPRF